MSGLFLFETTKNIHANLTSKTSSNQFVLNHIINLAYLLVLNLTSPYQLNPTCLAGYGNISSMRAVSADHPEWSQDTAEDAGFVSSATDAIHPYKAAAPTVNAAVNYCTAPVFVNILKCVHCMYGSNTVQYSAVQCSSYHARRHPHSADKNVDIVLANICMPNVITQPYMLL
jgi:hypothetical protein